MSSKDVKRLIRTIRRQGWRVRYARSGHWRCTSPTTGDTVTVASSPSASGAIHRARADLKRLGAQL